MHHRHRKELVLAVYPTTRGFAYILFEGPMAPVDWGVKEIKGDKKNARCLEAVGKLIERFQPEILVTEDCSARESRRSARIRRLYRAIEAIAHSQAIDVVRYSREQTRECFGKVGATTKYEIAQAISRLISELAHRMPPIRKPWMSEHPRMGLFDAASLAMTFYCQHDASPYQSDG